MPSSSNKQSKVGFVSLGCPKALVDSERILTQLKLDGYEISPSYDNADVVVVNTCGFIDSAKQESLEVIQEAINENGKVIVTGCMGNGSGAELIKQQLPSVLSVSGPADTQSVLTAVHQYAPTTKPSPNLNLPDYLPKQGIKLTPAHYAYLKISEGCNHRCSFCIIPSMRGDLVSRDLNGVVNEANTLVEAGVKELLVVSQDTSAYGVDKKYALDFINGKPYETRMLDLCKALGELDAWIRLHYVYPYPHVDKLLPLMAESKVLPYLDIPFQHAHPDVLKQMKRPGNIDKLSQRIHDWRNTCSDLTIRSTFIVGFPGETEEQFEFLLNWLDEVQLDRVGCFKYSAVEGATANDLANQVPEAVKEERWQRLMEKQQAISAARLQQKIDTVQKVIIDAYDQEQDYLIGRTQGDAPEIDGQVFIEPDNAVQIGDIVSVNITDADEYDLYATVNNTSN